MSTETAAPSDQKLAAIMGELDDARDAIPRRAIRQARKYRDAIIPLLIEETARAARIIRDGGKVTGNGPYVSLLLLAEFEAREAVPAIVDLISLPGEALFDVIGDGVTEDLCRILAALADDQLDLLDRLAANPALNEYVRGAAQKALVLLVRDGKLSRDEAVRRLSGQLRQQIEERSVQVSFTISYLCDLAAIEACDDVMRAFDEDLVEEFFVGDRAHVTESLERGESGLRKCLSRHPLGIEDTILELAWMERDDQSGSGRVPEPHWSRNTIVRKQERVGRNDPCPCGSGRKFKKCCGRH